MALDHGILNTPLHKRCSDAQLDRYLDGERRAANQRMTDLRKQAKSEREEIAAWLAGLSDARVLELAKPLGKRTPATARKALLSQADLNRAPLLRAIRREA